MASERIVHAEYHKEKVVRYSTTRKWHVEFDTCTAASSTVELTEAAHHAIKLEQQGGTIHHGLPGGRFFDRKVQQLKAGQL